MNFLYCLLCRYEPSFTNKEDNNKKSKNEQLSVVCDWDRSSLSLSLSCMHKHEEMKLLRRLKDIMEGGISCNKLANITTVIYRFTRDWLLSSPWSVKMQV